MKIERHRVTLADWARWSALLLFAAGLTVSCAPKESGASYVKTCMLPSDQSATLSGHWTVKPIPVAFHEGDWNDQEMNAIAAAANTWNSFFSVTLNTPMIDIGSSGAYRTSSAPKPSTICAQSIVSGNQFTNPVVIYKDTTWPYPNLPDAIALTTFCPSPASPLNSFYMAIVEVNYQNFFVPGRKIPDLQSILLHEFGHVVGLNHSCESTGSAGMPSCENANPDYLNAVMAPIFTFDQYGYGQVKQQLTDNDEGRANCLY